MNRVRAKSRPAGLVQVMVGVGVLVTSALGQVTERVSQLHPGSQGDRSSTRARVNVDGRYVVFTSDATNFYADSNGVSDVFRKDRHTGKLELASVDSNGQAGSQGSFSPAVSADGQQVVFATRSALDPADGNGLDDIYLHDFATGLTERVSTDPSGGDLDGPCFAPSLAEGVVSFASTATNLVTGAGGSINHLFLRDLDTGAYLWVDAGGNGNSSEPELSADGLVCSFYSDADNLVAGDNNQTGDVFVYHRRSGMTLRVSVNDLGQESNGRSFNSDISRDGRSVVFSSVGTNLVPRDTNLDSDVFVHDLRTAKTRRASVNSVGNQANAFSDFGHLSRSGRFVAFSSSATNLVLEDYNAKIDIFVHDLNLGTTHRVSLGSQEQECERDSLFPSISGEGQLVTFITAGSRIGDDDTNQRFDVYARSRFDAGWKTHGLGAPGSHGVPSIRLSEDPILGRTPTLGVSNASGVHTTGFWYYRLDLGEHHHSSRSVGSSQYSFGGGTLLFNQRWERELIVLDQGDNDFLLVLPFEPALEGLSLFTYMEQVDHGAPGGLSRTPMLEAQLGWY